MAGHENVNEKRECKKLNKVCDKGWKGKIKSFMTNRRIRTRGDRESECNAVSRDFFLKSLVPWA